MSPPPVESSPAPENYLSVGSDHTVSLPEVFRSIMVPARGRFWAKMGSFAGPGSLVAVGYIDPGNWATDIAGGARYGYALLSVIVLSNVLAMFLQTLALRLGIATGRDLAQLCRERFSRPTAILLWIACELAIMACDLAEIIGSAIGLQLLFGLPLIIGVCATALDVGVVLWLQSRGFRYIEALVIGLLLVVGACLAVEIVMAQPDLKEIAGSLLPSARIVSEPGMLYIAIGILGATVMPHNLYLHSAMTQTRRFDLAERGRREAMRFLTFDCTTALLAALFVNAAIMILAASFHRAGFVQIAEIEDAYRLLTPLFGTAVASLLFGVALLAAGQASAVTGTLAGQVVMEGFLRWRVSPVTRRLITRGMAITPAIIVTALCGEGATGRLLVLSQVILSLQLSFAVVPLVMFTSDRALMGPFANSGGARIAGVIAAVTIAVLNFWLVWQVLA